MDNTPQHDLDRHRLTKIASALESTRTYASRESAGPEIALVTRKFGVLSVQTT